jgi:hypothetical protein
VVSGITTTTTSVFQRDTGRNVDVSEKKPEKTSQTQDKPSSSAEEKKAPPTDKQLRALNIDILTLDHVYVQYSTSRKCFLLKSQYSHEVLHKLPSAVVSCCTERLTAMMQEKLANAIAEQARVFGKIMQVDQEVSDESREARDDTGQQGSESAPADGAGG